MGTTAQKVPPDFELHYLIVSMKQQLLIVNFDQTGANFDLFSEWTLAALSHANITKQLLTLTILTGKQLGDFYSTSILHVR